MGWAGGWDGYWKVKAVGNDIEMEARTCGAILDGDGKVRMTKRMWELMRTWDDEEMLDES